MTAKELAENVRSIGKRELTDQQVIDEIDKLYRHRLFTFGEYAYVQQCSYRTVQRMVRQGKVRKFQTPSGPRIMGISVLS